MRQPRMPCPILLPRAPTFHSRLFGRRAKGRNASRQGRRSPGQHHTLTHFKSPLIASALSSPLRRLVVDTNVLTGTLFGHTSYNRRVVRACLEGQLRPLIGQTLFLEYEDVLNRTALFRSSLLTRKERQDLFAAFLSVCEWVQIYFSWRPNLPDENDNHVIELAVAGGAAMIVTNNTRDFRTAELRFPGLRALTPRELVEEINEHTHSSHS